MTEYITVSHETVGGSLLDRPMGPLERFITLFGFELDGIHSEYDALLHVNDPMAVPASSLPYVAADLGFPYEGSLGDTRVRYLLARLLQLRKQKGTLPGAHGFIEALTGYPTDVRVGTNLLLDINDSDFLTSVGTWNSSLATVQRVTSPTPGAHSGIPGAPYLKMNPINNLNTSAGAGTGLIPIPAHKENRPGTYTFSGWLAGAGPFPAYSGATAYVPGDCVSHDVGSGPQHFICIQAGTGHAPPDSSYWQWYWNMGASLGAYFFNARGKRVTGVGPSPVAPFVVPDFDGGFDENWFHFSVSFDPPDGAAYIQPVFGISAGLSNVYTWNFLYLSEPTLTYTEVPSGADTVFESARKIHVFCEPARVNMLQNPSVQDSIGSGGLGNGEWRPYDGSTGVLAYDFNHGIDGEGALKVRIDADGAFVGAQAATDVSEQAIVGECYTGSAFVYCPPGVTVELVLEFTDTTTGTDVFMPPNGATYTSGVIIPTPNVYMPLEVSGVADKERALFTVKFYGNDSMIGYMDKAMVEKAPSRQQYFDGDTPSTYGEYAWEGTPHSSASTFHLHKSIREAVLARHLPEWIPGETEYDVTYTAAP